MSWDLRVIHAKDFLRTNVSGALDFETSKNILDELVSVESRIADFDFLIDIRDTDSHTSITDIYILVGEMVRHKELIHKRKIAVLDQLDDNFVKTQFFEVCSRNRGFSVRAFTEFEEAMNWLTGETPIAEGGGPQHTA